MNVRKMRQIGKDILSEPRRFNMDQWAANIRDRNDAEIINHSLLAIPPCGTALCFCGAWAVRYGGFKPKRLVYDSSDENGNPISYLAELDLDLPNHRLFFMDEWPEELQPNSRMKPGTQKYAEYFVNKVLESYISTNGWSDVYDNG